MSGLSEATWRAALARLEDVSRPEEFGAAAVDALDIVVRSEITTYNAVDPRAGHVDYDARPSFEVSEEALALLGRRGHEHPLIAHYESTLDGSAHKISDLLTEEEFHANEFYRVIYGPLGVEDQMAIVLPSVRPVVVGLVANRSARDFTEDDRRAMNLLRPLLASYHRIVQERARLHALVSATGGVLSSMDIHALLLGDTAWDVTGAATTLLRDFFGAPRDGRPCQPASRSTSDRSVRATATRCAATRRSSPPCSARAVVSGSW
jgi:hypothetical protein